MEEIMEKLRVVTSGVLKYVALDDLEILSISLSNCKILSSLFEYKFIAFPLTYYVRYKKKLCLKLRYNW